MRAKVERQLVEISKKKAGNGAMGEKTGVKIETDDQIEGSRLGMSKLFCCSLICDHSQFVHIRSPS